MTEEVKDETQALTVRLPKPLHERLRRLAYDTRTPMNQIVIDAIEAEIGVSDEPKEIQR
jgi:predicted DNA-binding protein